MPPVRDSLAVSGSQGQIPAGATIGGQFRIEAFTGQDAVSQSYRATDVTHQSGAAVRIIPMRVLGAAAAQLETDIEKASALVHKNLVEILNVGREADFFYIATELLDGQTLREFVDGRKQEGRNVSFKGACNLLTHIANGLERAASSLAHGGLNPAAIWVNKAGRVKVAELGLPQTLPSLARRGGPAGAPDQSYVAPEVLSGSPPTLTSDVYSLGIMMYEVLTGRLPSSPFRPASQQADGVPPAIDAVIAKALARDPGARYQNVMDLRHAIAAAQSGGEVSAHGPPARQPIAALPTVGDAQDEAPPGDDQRRSTFGRSFNMAEVAGGAVDDAQERWLVQKDKLDFGPFSMAQIRAQIERGEIIGEHVVVDSDTGARKKVKDFPQLRELSKTSERRIEQQRRAHAEIKHEKSEKVKSRFVLMVGGTLLFAMLAGIGYYVLSRKASDTTKLASREEEAEIDAFLKDVKLNFVQAKVAKRAAGGGHRSGGGAVAGDGDFSNDANFGDASKSANAGDDVLDDQTIEEVMRSHYRGLVPCLMQERHKNPGVREMSVDFVVRGTGKVSAVKVNGQKGGSFANCVLGRMPAFPKFNGSKTIASWSMSMR